MSVRDTSRQAFASIVPIMGERQAQVYAALTHENLTNNELAHRLRMPINCVTPRVHELRNMGMVEEAGKRHCHITGRMAYVWGVKPAST